MKSRHTYTHALTIVKTGLIVTEEAQKMTLPSQSLCALAQGRFNVSHPLPQGRRFANPSEKMFTPDTTGALFLPAITHASKQAKKGTKAWKEER